MRNIKYKQSEFLLPWKWRKKKPLPVFILEIPHAVYFSVAPGRLALNEVLVRGEMGGGMGTGMFWDPFELDEEAYRTVLSHWRNFDLRTLIGASTQQIPDLSFVFDEEVMSISSHIGYIELSVQK